MTWRSPGAEIRCIAPARHPTFAGELCGRIVTRVPEGWRYRVVGLVAHTSLADDRHFVFACRICGHWHETEAQAMDMELREAA